MSAAAAVQAALAADAIAAQADASQAEPAPLVRIDGRGGRPCGGHGGGDSCYQARAGLLGEKGEKGASHEWHEVKALVFGLKGLASTRRVVWS